jgi:hypothetical protein
MKGVFGCRDLVNLNDFISSIIVINFFYFKINNKIKINENKE